MVIGAASGGGTLVGASGSPHLAAPPIETAAAIIPTNSKRFVMADFSPLGEFRPGNQRRVLNDYIDEQQRQYERALRDVNRQQTIHDQLHGSFDSLEAAPGSNGVESAPWHYEDLATDPLRPFMSLVKGRSPQF
jgi:hypothetical protein